MMPTVKTNDGVQLYWEVAGQGRPVLFIHELGGDHRSWQPQVAHFARRYRCIIYAARGYPPSQVPQSQGSYSQSRAVEDAIAVLDAAEVSAAHLVGNSMGGFCALHLGMTHPDRARSLVVAGCGYGAHPSQAERFRRESLDLAARYDIEGSQRSPSPMALGHPASSCVMRTRVDMRGTWRSSPSTTRSAPR